MEQENPISPELALVDPDAAEEARRALPEVVLYEDRPRTAAPPPPRYEEVRRLFSEEEAEAAEEPRRPSRRRRLLAVLVIALLLGAVGVLAAALVGVWSIEPRPSRVAQEPVPLTTSAPPPATTAPPPTTATTAPILPTTTAAPKTTSAPATTTAPAKTAPPPKTTTAAPKTTTTAPKATTTAPKPTTTAPKPTTRPRHAIPPFVWVERPGARRYDVEFTAGGEIVYATTTKQARLTVPPAALPPGRYRWRVWAVGPGGDRTPEPLVDARVEIP